jgi:hypothetical protein
MMMIHVLKENLTADTFCKRQCKQFFKNLGVLRDWSQDAIVLRSTPAITSTAPP